MILAVDWMQYSIYFLYATLGILLFYIGYRYLVRKWSRNYIPKENYVTLLSYEKYAASGEITLYFEVFKNKEIEFFISNPSGEKLISIYKGICKPGGHQFKVDTAQLTDGDYYYTVITDNQRIEKLLRVRNNQNK